MKSRMARTDSTGYPLSGASDEALEIWERANHELRCLVDDPLASIDAALAEAPALTLGHLFRAWLMLLGTELGTSDEARASLATAAALPATERERGHLAAVQALVDGHWMRASRVMEDLSLRWPCDALALQVGHQIDFFTGCQRLLRDRIARALPDWDAARPGYHALCGMYAFGLEECGDYVQAERSGRRAVELEPRDSWAWHAVAHVHEMRNDVDAGLAWLGAHEATWSAGSFLATHNHWHLALFHLEHDDVVAVLECYDTAIGGTGSALVLDLIDASAMLWRLALRGVDVGDRWQPLAQRWHGLADVSNYAFNDLHAMLAYTGARDEDGQARALAALERAAAQPSDSGDNRRFAGEVGLPAARAIRAFGRGDYRGVIDALRTVRDIAQRFGGSHAQRDLLELTLIEAVLRACDRPLALGLARERQARRPASPLAGRFIERALSIDVAAGTTKAAHAAETLHGH